jgi:hypothetical protein
MPAPTFTLIDAGRTEEVAARIRSGRVFVAPEDGRSALGWELTPEGLCGEGQCIPVLDGSALAAPEGLDLAVLAHVLDRPLALDLEERAAYLGVGAADRRRTLAAGLAPDFTLPDLAGRLHSLAEHRGEKVLLVAWASW